jgi:DNA-directed RNA polymerase subunit H (RpoH/RPB5)
MSIPQSYQIEKTDEDIRKTVLKNLVIMIMERGILKRENLENHLSRILGQKSDDFIYRIKPEIENHPDIVIKLYTSKITSVNKTSNIHDFLTKHNEHYKIVVAKDMNENNVKHIKSTFARTEIFIENYLMENIMESEYAVRYEIIPKDTDIYKKFWDDYFVKKKEMPRMFMKDPMVLYYNLKLHDLVRVIRPSESTGLSPSYRLVV